MREFFFLISLIIFFFLTQLKFTIPLYRRQLVNIIASIMNMIKIGYDNLLTFIVKALSKKNQSSRVISKYYSNYIIFLIGF